MIILVENVFPEFVKICKKKYVYMIKRKETLRIRNVWQTFRSRDTKKSEQRVISRHNNSLPDHSSLLTLLSPIFFMRTIL